MLEELEQRKQEDQSDPLEAFLADPPGWFETQALGCWYGGQIVEGDLNALAAAAFEALLDDHAVPWDDVRAAVERWLRARGEPLKRNY